MKTINLHFKILGSRGRTGLKRIVPSIALAAACFLRGATTYALDLSSLDSVTFIRGMTISDDLGVPYSNPSWSPTWTKPLIFNRGSVFPPVTVISGALSNPSTVQIHFQGLGPDNITFKQGDSYQIIGPSLVPFQIQAALVTTNELPNTVKYYQSFSVQWQYATRDDEFSPWGAWRTIGTTGTSTNVLYLTLATPTTTLYRSVVHWACANNTAADQDTAVANIWNNFKAPNNVKTWTNQTLYYYQPGYNFAQAQDLAGLLQSKRGQCGAWREFFKNCALVHNIQVANTMVVPMATNQPDQKFIVKKWSTLTGTKPTPYFWGMTFYAYD